MQLRPYQIDAVNSIFEYFLHKKGNPCLALPTGCHAKGHMILMFDGSIKTVENVGIGDLIMGPDSKPRRVLHLARGRQEMVRISPLSGKSFIVNKDHILPFYVCAQKAHPKYESQKARIENVKISDYMKSTKWFKHIRKIQQSGIIHFEERTLPIDPYFVGLHIGDGSFTHGAVTFTNMDEEILKWYSDFCNSLGVTANVNQKEGNKAFNLVLSKGYRGSEPGTWGKMRRHEIANHLSSIGLENCTAATKFVPIRYKINSLKNRLEILAGLLDSDGFSSNNCFEISTKSERLANDILFISRSCGFRANVAKEFKTCQTGNGDFYYRVMISGDVERIPCKRKKHIENITERKQIKNWLITGIEKIEELQEDDFFGFELDGDHLYLDSDFVIHHNTGKSLVIADFVKKVLSYWPSQRILLLTHIKELVIQDAEKLLAVWPDAPLGIYSAGIGKKESFAPIVFGGIDSIVNNIEDIGFRDLCIVDEAHRISPKDSSNYQKTFAKLREINPKMKVIGLTATPYRLGQGMITDDGLFDDICFDLTKLDDFNKLIKDGYLCHLIPKRTVTQLDISSVGISNGDYKQNELQKAVDVNEITYRAIQEVLEQGADRQCWMFFASGVEHAEHITECLQSFGISAVCVHSKMPTKQRDDNIRDFKAGIHRAIVGNNVLTTGFDHPPIDLIAFLRPTTSPGLWVQCLGRGTRPFNSKENCLVLDFSGNTARLGPINDPVIPKKRGKSAPGEVPVKLCPQCGIYYHSSVRMCSACGYEFPRYTKLQTQASEAELIKTLEPEIRFFDIDRVIYAKHQKPGAPASLRVTYFSGIKKFEEYVCLEHQGFARKKAADWWLKRISEKIPYCVDEALSYISELRKVRRIEVIINRKYPEIINHEF